MNAKVLRAVFKRNFVSYFANPTGYVFICVFVLLSTIAAFWPNEFFSTNLANLDQLSFSPANPLRSFPFIMLIFIPAITMSIWADERRQGTDELLLTIPASDLDIVLGKYLAAVAIYSVALLFSAFCNYSVLAFLGDPDVGLLVGTYVGYWLIGLAMLAIGMVASFLTSNLTIAYILGAVFNVPLVFAAAAGVISSREVSLAVKQWSIGEQFRDFGRGILSLSGLVYFGMIVAVMLYLSVVLIGRRHWREAQGKLPNHVFYSLLHLAWLLSFASFWIVLKARFDPTHLFICLAALYLVLQAALLWGWSLPGRTGAKPLDAVVALLHLVVIAGFVVFMILGAPRVDNVYVLTGAFILYLLIHAGLAFGWFRFAGNAALLPGQYAVRVQSLVVIAVGAVLFFNEHGLRRDITGERLRSLSPYTVELLQEVRKHTERPVQIEAFISPAVPEGYVETRLNVISMLEELDARGGEKVRLQINGTERFTKAAARAEKRYDITPREVSVEERKTYSRESLFMGVAFTCGLEKVVIPFIDRGIPVEYELARSIATVTDQKRKKVGVVRTDARLYGGFNTRGWPIIEELEKQYEVEEVDVMGPITEDYDVLLAVQPSSLGPEQMESFLAAIRSGMPTAIFEDPLPVWPDVPGTTEPRRPPGGMNPFMGPQPQMPKADLFGLLDLLKIDFSDIPDPRLPVGRDRRGPRIVWQDYNPSRRFPDLPKEFVFIGKGSGAKEPFSERAAITSGLQQMLFPFPGFVTNKNISNLKFTPLVRTGDRTGTVDSNAVFTFGLFGRGPLNRRRPQVSTEMSYVLAAHITGKLPPDTFTDDEGGNGGDDQQGGNGDSEEEVSRSDESEPEASGFDESEQEKPSRPKEPEVNVVLVADIDMLHPNIFMLRERGPDPETGIHFDFDNVTFVLNVLDMLAGDDRFVEIRKRRPKHRSLTRIDEETDKARKDTARRTEELQNEYEKAKEKEDKAVEDYVKKLKEDYQKDPALSAADAQHRLDMVEDDRERRKLVKLEQLEQERDREIERIQTELNLQIQRLQDTYKMWAVLLPPIPPLLVAVAVFFTRRVREREGVARSRLRS